MSDRFLLHKPSGVIYIYNDTWAQNPDFVECADAQGTSLADGSVPDIVIPDAKPKRTRKPAADDPVVVDAEIDPVDAALSADASRNLP